MKPPALAGRLALAALLVALALASWLLKLSIDGSVLALVTLAVLLVVLPLERLSSLKAAGVEFALDNAPVRKAVEDLAALKPADNVTDERLRELLGRLGPEIERASGCRVLWVDHNPYHVFGERRLLRALNIETVMATSSEQARCLLCEDGDFDLIVSDVKRGERGANYSRETPPEGVRFVKQLREDEACRRQGRLAHVPALPVIFYTSMEPALLFQYLECVPSGDAPVEVTRGVEMLLREVFRTLARVRSDPVRIVYRPRQAAVGQERQGS
jgi:CheY-like chemotaxis protein